MDACTNEQNEDTITAKLEEMPVRTMHDATLFAIIVFNCIELRTIVSQRTSYELGKDGVRNDSCCVL